MRYLVYVSQAEHPMDEGELRAILDCSRERNARDGVTGLLVYRYSEAERRGNFLQILEGDAGAVDATWRRIAADGRHHTKVVIEEGEIAARAFPGWSMGFRNVEAGDLAGVEGYADLGSDAFWARAAAGSLPVVLDALRAFDRSG